MRLLHSGDLGDVVYAMPCIKAFAQDHGPVDLYLKPCTSGHPWGGTHFTRERAEWLLPLLAAQEYVASASIWDGEEVDVDLNLFRRLPLSFSLGHIGSWYEWAFPVHYDLGLPWLSVEAPYHGGIVVNRTVRYQNPEINYRFLAGRGVYFVGLPGEYEEFLRQVPDARHVLVHDALELAKLIVGSRLFVGGQSCAYAVGEGAKATRLLEVSPRHPNVIPHGPGGHSAVTQLGFEFWVDKLTASVA